jgi:fructokinase
MMTVPARPLIVGEVLFDCFQDRQVLGGAPFNVAWNLKGLGLDPCMVSSVGDDPLGRQGFQAMQRWGLDTVGLQVDSRHPTGRVDIQTKDGEPAYQFWDDVAFDHLSLESNWPNSLSVGLLYHGSLALRNQNSRSTILALRQQATCPVFVDVNIRMPHFDPMWAGFLLTGADHVKLNDVELQQLTGKNIELSLEPAQSWRDRWQLGRQLMQAYDIKQLWITAGQQGAAWLGCQNQFVQVQAAPVINLVDTVGAGDALSAAVIFGILNSQSPQESLEAGVKLASRVCGIQGAIADHPDFYRS